MLSRLASSLLLAALAVGAQAAGVSQKTDTVKGRAPVASNVAINNQSYPHFVGARAGHTISVGYGFDDADGDADSSAIQWLRDGTAINGATASTYTVQSADANRSLSVQVTPKTDPAITDPASGVAIASAAIKVVTGALPVGIFLAPDTVLRTWSQANSYCLQKGARLPTLDELQQLFLSATSATVIGDSNTEMCSVYGWPLSAQCGGPYGSSNYWFDEPPGPTHHKDVFITSGGVHYSNDLHTNYAACVR